MTALPQSASDVSPLVTAALLLAARTAALDLGLPCPKATAILEATGAGRTQAYKLAKEVPGALTTRVKPSGRPRALRQEPARGAELEVSRRVIDYLVEHPGCVTTGGQRRLYSEGYRCFVLELCAEYEGLGLEAFAEAVTVPLPTLRDWLRGEVTETAEPVATEAEAKDREATSARIETVLHQWEQWEGDLAPFCDHLRAHHHISWGRTMIASILEQTGVRTPRRRQGRRDDGTLRGAFETFFPGAQWQGDGTAIVVRVGACDFGFNVELMVDAHSSALAGFSIRDAEDSAAVIEAFHDGVETTGAPPVALELDGRPSNHTEEVKAALGETILIRSRPGKPQSNPHVEGAHGLFKKVAPPLVIDADDPRALARQLLTLVRTTWARTLNHKPRRDRGGRSRADISADAEPTEEEIKRARAALRERARRQERALQTRRTRTDPEVRAVVDRLWSPLDLDDPEGRVRDAISRYPIDAVLAAIATFEGKREAGTLPKDADARYLLGIVRNITAQDEGQAITVALLRARLEARDLMLARLAQAREALLASETGSEVQMRSAIDLAMKAVRRLDRLFWLDLVAELILGCDEAEQAELVKRAAVRIHAFFSVPSSERQGAVRFLVEQVVGLA